MLLFRLIIVSVFSALLLMSCKLEEQKIHYWDLQSHASETSVDFIELQRFVENVKVMSAGRLIITAHSGGKITTGPDIYSAVSDGRVEMGNGWPNWWAHHDAAWSVMNSGPFDFMNLDSSMMFFLIGDGTELANKLSKPHGVMWRAAWWPGMEFGLMSKSPINNLDDLKEKKVRIGPGLPSEVLSEASGAYTIPLVAQDIYRAIENDDIDAVEWTTSGGVLDLGIHNIAPYAIVPAIWQPSVVSDFLINEKAYDNLSDDLKAILETAIKSYTLTTTLKSKLSDFDAFSELQKQGVQIVRWSESDIERWRLANEKVLLKYETTPHLNDIIKRKKSFKKQYQDYYRYFNRYD